jgi:hypothetical protein
LIEVDRVRRSRYSVKRLLVLVSSVALLVATASISFAAEDPAKVRVVHASPDAPAVDVLVNDGRAFSNAPFKGITSYADLAPGTYNVKVVPAGATSPVVINADLGLNAGMSYTVVAAGMLANIEPIVLMDDSPVPAAGKAHVRFVHLSPDAPAVDIAVTGGPVVFANVPFKGVGAYTPVDAGTYDLEARVAGTGTVALSVPGVALVAGKAYTIYAVGLVGDQPALSAIASEDSIRIPTPKFQLGFAALAALIPDIVGAPLENEWHNPATGDTLQRTTTGLMVWRKADNWTAFTDGHWTWVNGPHGLEQRLNTERFAWEHR